MSQLLSINKLDDSTYHQIFKWYERCIQKYGIILLSLYKDDKKYNNYCNNLDKLHEILDNYINNVKLSQQQYNDFNCLLNKINLLLINVKLMKNNLVKTDIIGGRKISRNKRKKSIKGCFGKKSSRIILSPKRMYSTIATGWL